MAAPLTKTKEERMQRRARVSELYIEGRSMAEVGKIIGVSHDTVFRDIRWCREQWRTRAADNIQKHTERELARIDHLDIEAWRGWFRSIGMIKTVKNETGTGAQGSINKTIETIERKAGDPRFLAEAFKCIERRCRILGLDAPNKIGFGSEGKSELVGRIIVEHTNYRRKEDDPVSETRQG